MSARLGAPTLEELKPFEPGAASRPSVVLAPGFRLTGDLDGDGAGWQ